MVLTLKQFFVIMMTMMSGVVDALKEHAICPVRISLLSWKTEKKYLFVSFHQKRPLISILLQQLI